MDDPPRDLSLVTSARRLLGDALDDSGSDLRHVFDSLTQRFADAVDSLVATMVTVVDDDRPFTIRSESLSGGPVVATLSIPLTVSETTSCVLVLAASSPHAFMTLAHDAASELGVGAGIEHDTRLDAFVDGADGGMSDLTERSIIDHAIGVLLDRGPYDSVASARAALVATAVRSGRPLGEAARDIVDAAMDVEWRPDVTG